jgi:putative membrane protein
MIARSVLAAAFLLAGAFGASAQNATPVTSDEFVSKAGVAGMFEIRSSEIALKASSNAEVKSFAHQMIKDHSKAAKVLKSTAQASIGAKVPTALDAEHQQVLDDLKGKKGQAFDKAYLDDQVQAHDDAVALFSGYSESGDNAKLKQFAAETLPTLKMHQEHARKLDSGNM